MKKKLLEGRSVSWSAAAVLYSDSLVIVLSRTVNG